MEVDFFCAEPASPSRSTAASTSRMPLPGDVIAARTPLLQTHGFFVLRFLAEDLGKRLEWCSTRS